MLRSDPSTIEPDLAWPDLPPDHPRGGTEVTVVAASLHCTPAREREVASWLSPEEHERARAFSRPELRRRYVASRGVLREVLAPCAGVEPGALTFGAGPHGKPGLRGHDGLQFNLAHSADLLVLAVGTCGGLGVDVEAIRPMSDAVALARRFFTKREAAWLEAQPVTDREARFFRLWTRKEAVLKACGLGIAHGLDRLELIESAGTWKTQTVFPEASSSGWTLRELTPAPGYVGALAMPAGLAGVACHSWRGA